MKRVPFGRSARYEYPLSNAYSQGSCDDCVALVYAAAHLRVLYGATVQQPDQPGHPQPHGGQAGTGHVRLGGDKVWAAMCMLARSLTGITPLLLLNCRYNLRSDEIIVEESIHDVPTY